MYIFHGTTLDAAIDIVTNGINLAKSKERLDFGPGFYTTNERKFAEKTACYRAARYRSMSNEHTICPAVVMLECVNLKDEELRHKLQVKEFNISGRDWLEFIVINRCSRQFVADKHYENHNKDQKFDIVLGPTADGGIATIAEDFEAKEIELGIGLLRSVLPSYGTQISFHTKKGLSCIKPIEYDIIEY